MRFSLAKCRSFLCKQAIRRWLMVIYGNKILISMTYLMSFTIFKPVWTCHPKNYHAPSLWKDIIIICKHELSLLQYFLKLIIQTKIYEMNCVKYLHRNKECDRITSELHFALKLNKWNFFKIKFIAYYFTTS